MYLYLIVFFLVTGLFVLDYCFSISIKWLLYLEIIILSAFLVFRYGQGTDYFAYSYIFSQFTSFSNVIHNPAGVHSELGFRLLCYLFKDYQLFIMIVSVYEMCMLCFFLHHNKVNNYLVLYLVFHTIYLTYFFSTIRQGLVLASFIGIGIPLIEKKEWNKLIILCFVLSFIHTISLVWLVIPLMKYIETKTMLRYFLPISIILGLIMSTGIFKSFIYHVPYIGSYLTTYLNEQISLFAFVERLVTLILITVLVFTQFEEDAYLSFVYKIYLIGNVLYFSISPYTLIASRTIICFRILELILIPILMTRKSKYRQLASIYFILLPSIMYFHNIGGYIIQGDYYDSVNIINYPYVNIFNKNSIWSYRSVNYYYSLTN